MDSKPFHCRKETFKATEWLKYKPLCGGRQPSLGGGPLITMVYCVTTLNLWVYLYSLPTLNVYTHIYTVVYKCSFPANRIPQVLFSQWSQQALPTSAIVIYWDDCYCSVLREALGFLPCIRMWEKYAAKTMCVIEKYYRW